MKKILLIVSLILFTAASKAGLLWNDPVFLFAQPDPHLFSKDEIHFWPTGIHKGYMVRDVTCTLTATYKDGHKTSSTLKVYCFYEGSPMTFVLPDGWFGIHSFKITGTCWYLMHLDPNAKLPKGATINTLTDKQLSEMMEIKRGYKIDSEFWPK